MKTEITKEGHLFIKAETQIEGYALRKFYEENWDDAKKELKSDNIFFDASMTSVTASYEHHVQKCEVCNGTGKIFDSNSTAMNTCCPNCNGTGNVWV